MFASATFRRYSLFSLWTTDFAAQLPGVRTIACPLTPAIRLSSAIQAILNLHSSVAEPMCGVRITFFIDRSLWSSGNGSGAVTSRAAAEISPFRRAEVRSSVSTTSPRAMLIRCAVGFIIFSCFEEISPFVLGVKGTTKNKKSALFRQDSSVLQYLGSVMPARGAAGNTRV
eukprot:CAMPEP_0185281238 /NCGR_PEP_ID=MMETSP1359-20130426/66610_1 /TAXON_ID=552665 /ORGANISM="Bigelowiella longifila, Strain CCMP242" /LENGTH=170 /DNA_ID=CAMNT_0027876653 /DNA_START=286 /DNA_END=798 /DNA_ORIENTATION=+